MKYPAYPAYKESRVEWIGKIPEHWNHSRLKYTTYLKGRVGWHGLNSDEFSDEGIHLVTGTDFKNGTVNWNTCYRISFERYEEDPYIQLKEDDLLITKDGTIGKLAVVKQLPERASLNSGIFLVRPKTGDYISDFLYWVLSSNTFCYFNDLTKSGTTIIHLYQNVFENFDFTLPSILEQKSIVTFLDQKTALIDDLIAKKGRQIELMKEKRTSLINRAVTKGLNPDVAMKDSGIEWLGEVPEHWEVLQLKRIASIRYGLGQPPKEALDGLPIIRATNIFRGIISDKDMMYVDPDDVPAGRCAELSVGEILVVRSGAYTGDSAIVTPKYEGAIAGYDMVVTINKGVPEYYGWQIISSHVYELQFGISKMRAAQPHLNAEELCNTIITFPPKDEQKQIASYLDSQVQNFHDVISLLYSQIEKLREYRQSLISATVTGKIDVRNHLQEAIS